MNLARLTPQPQIRAAQGHSVVKTQPNRHPNRYAGNRGCRRERERRGKIFGKMSESDGVQCKEHKDAASFLCVPCVLLRPVFAAKTKTCMIVVRIPAALPTKAFIESEPAHPLRLTGRPHCRGSTRAGCGWSRLPQNTKRQS